MNDIYESIAYTITINDPCNDPIYDLIIEKDDREEELKELAIVVSWLIRNGIRFTITYEDNTCLCDCCKGGDAYE